ncbi:MAG: DUF3108 domain-containing protein [Rhodospirillales bacterium]|nr:DUF3108 domain-containing protein [Rhodospirillales bacterium]
MERQLYIQAFIPRIIILSSLLFSAPAAAETREFTYEVYAGGIHAVQAKFNFDVQRNTYNAAVAAKTRGWLESLVPWSGIFQTVGTVTPDAFSPTKHETTSTWRGKTETKTFLYQNNKLKSLTIKEDGSPTETPDIDPTLTDGTTDLLSATLEVMKDLIATQKCEGTSDIYDGRRRFAMYFKDKGQKTLDKSRYNIFSGPARLCEIEIEPKGGHWHKKPRGWLLIQEQGRQKGALPSVWMAKVEGFEYAIPVKIQVKTDYGTLLMHLTRVQ